MMLCALYAYAGGASGAFAYSEKLKSACESDYTAYCSQHPKDSPATRACMKAHRKMLTEPCVQAIARSGEASAAEIKQYKQEKGR